MPSLPAGTVTFLFTDLEGSTRLLQHLGDRYAALLQEYRRLLQAACRERGGREVDTQGDALFVAFPRAHDAVAGAVSAQQTIAGHRWPEDVTVRARMGIHTGEPLKTETGYVGMDVHRAARICQAGHGGQILLSQTTSDLIEDDLPAGVGLRDLGRHRLKDLAQPQHLYQVVAAGLPGEFPPLRSLDAHPNNLPIQLTSFIGREREMAAIANLLEQHRLVTLVGAGGSGKTRLSLQVAAHLLDAYPDGAWWVDLAGLIDGSLVPEAVAAVLRVREQSGTLLLTTLGDFLQPRTALLLLDNCEHLVAGCGQLAEALLQRCPDLRILATSREGLAVGGEALFPVPTLSLPDLAHLPPLESLSQYEAVRLFAERAATVSPAFKITARNAAVVAQICHRLDGIPLAMELAAARVTVLSPEQIASRLDDQFRLLTGGSRTALPRHQTLQGALDWSFQSLAEPEKSAFRRLAVFAGGFTLQAAEAVCAGEGIATADVLDLLAHLVNKSLVVVEDREDDRRYRLLEPTRQYARDRLREVGEIDGTRARHVEWFLAFAEETEEKLHGREQVTWLRRMETEHENLRTALEWTVAGDHWSTALRLAAALAAFWELHGHITEGRRRLDEVLSRSAGASLPPLRARGLYAAASFAADQHDWPQAKTLASESLTLYQESGDTRGEAAALRLLGTVARWQSDYEAAAGLYQQSLSSYQQVQDTRGVALANRSLGELARAQKRYPEAAARFTASLELFREVGDKASISHTLYLLGLTARAQGAFAQATAHAEEALALSRELEDAYAAAHAIHLLGTVAWYQGDIDRAAALHEQSLPLFQELGDWNCVGTTTTDLGLVAQGRGDLERAASLHKDALRRRSDLGDKPGIAECLERLAAVVEQRGDGAQAARLVGSAEALREALKVPLPPVERPRYEQLVAAVRTSIGEAAFAAAWTAGREMTAERAVTYALGEI